MLGLTIEPTSVPGLRRLSTLMKNDEVMAEVRIRESELNVLKLYQTSRIFVCWRLLNNVNTLEEIPLLLFHTTLNLMLLFDFYSDFILPLRISLGTIVTVYKLKKIIKEIQFIKFLNWMNIRTISMYSIRSLSLIFAMIAIRFNSENRWDDEFCFIFGCLKYGVYFVIGTSYVWLLFILMLCRSLKKLGLNKFLYISKELFLVGYPSVHYGHYSLHKSDVSQFREMIFKESNDELLKVFDLIE